MAEDVDWAEHATAVQENPEHYGKFLVVYDKNVLAVGEDLKVLVERAAERAGAPRQYLVTLIVPRPGLWDIPH